MRSLKIDLVTLRLIIPFQFVEGKDKVVQDLIIRLKTHFSEWFLDERKGLKYRELIFNGKIDKNHLKDIESHIRQIILETKEVTSIISYVQKITYSNLEYPKLEINFSVTTSFGTVTISENLTI